MEPPIHYQKLPVWVPFPWWVTGLQPMDMEGLPVSEDKELRGISGFEEKQGLAAVRED